VSCESTRNGPQFATARVAGQRQRPTSGHDIAGHSTSRPFISSTLSGYDRNTITGTSARTCRGRADAGTRGRADGGVPGADNIVMSRPVDDASKPHTSGAHQPAAQYLQAGMIANADQLASVTASTMSGGAAHGCRALELRVMGGIDLRLLPDRGLDIGAAWFAGIPLGWISAVGETGPLSALQGSAWLDAFGGGLLVTCGLRNVGAPSEGHGLHGRYSHLPARNVLVTRTVKDGEPGRSRPRKQKSSSRPERRAVQTPGRHSRARRRSSGRDEGGFD